MIDHRRLQRALFRVQLDSRLATDVWSGKSAARASLDLGREELALLLALDPAGVTADPGGRRRTQVLANASSEFTLTLAHAARSDESFLQVFAIAPELHAAMRAEQALPFAFAAYAARLAAERNDRALAGLVELEHALARARRAHRAPGATAVPPGAIALAPGVELARLPDGLFAYASAVRLAIDAENPAPERPVLPDPREAAELVAVVPRGAASVHRLAEVHAERLEPPADRLFAELAESTASTPFDAARRAAFAHAHGAAPESLERFLDGLVEDGFLIRS